MNRIVLINVLALIAFMSPHSLARCNHTVVTITKLKNARVEAGLASDTAFADKVLVDNRGCNGDGKWYTKAVGA